MGRKENGPLEELCLKVGDGESGVRWGWWGTLEPDRMGLTGQSQKSEIFPRSRHSCPHVTYPQSSRNLTHCCGGKFHMWQHSPGTAGVSPKHGFRLSAQSLL